jgi:hypothetical protein
MKLLTAKQLTKELQISSRTMFRLRASEQWTSGIHFFKLSPAKILYHLELIQDWLANIDNPHLHENAIESFLESLPSNQRPTRKSTKKAGNTPAQGD